MVNVPFLVVFLVTWQNRCEATYSLITRPNCPQSFGGARAGRGQAIAPTMDELRQMLQRHGYASDLLLSKMNLAGWLHPHFALTCPEAIERLVIERDDFFRRQGIAIIGGVSIAGKQHVVALGNSPADGSIYTILRLAPGDDQA